MEHEWKVGDRFTLEYLITKVVDDYVIAEIGDAKNILSAEEMELAKLIKSAATEPQKLDVTKPIREKSTCMVLEYLTTDIIGTIWTKTPSGNVQVFQPSDLENIPIPKIKGRREVVLLSDGSVTFTNFVPLEIIGRAWVEITEGDGMGSGCHD